jgi:hypothetical protein
LNVYDLGVIPSNTAPTSFILFFCSYMKNCYPDFY